MITNGAYANAFLEWHVSSFHGLVFIVFLLGTLGNVHGSLVLVGVAYP
jgi:hypothetical protein